MNEGRKKALTYLKTARGQLDFVISMFEEERYCIDIATQILAVDGLVKKANVEILKQHMNSCVKEAFESEDYEDKVDEMMKVISKLMDSRL
ncbi:MAG: metal-sensing transcriptional repressor [Vallitaleaceae bacterium]|nr:metal-sensing transcriptional repressor [Vallitaleaceae bacterium]